MDFSIQPIMFVLLFTYVFGGAVSGSPHQYLMFALPGIIVQNALFTTLNTGVGLATDLEKGFFDRLKSLPIARFAPLAGRIGADLVKQAWSVALLLGVGALLGFRVGSHGFVGHRRVVRDPADRVAVRLLGDGAGEHAGRQPGEGADLRLRRAVPAHVRVRPRSSRPTPCRTGCRYWVKVNPVTVLSNALRGLLESGPIAGTGRIGRCCGRSGSRWCSHRWPYGRSSGSHDRIQGQEHRVRPDQRRGDRAPAAFPLADELRVLAHAY